MSDQLEIRLFAGLVDAAGTDRITLPAVPGETIDGLKSRIATACPKLGPHLPTLAIAVNEGYARGGDAVHATDRVALIPPVSGG